MQVGAQGEQRSDAGVLHLDPHSQVVGKQGRDLGVEFDCEGAVVKLTQRFGLEQIGTVID